jgi:HSP20 family protein
VARETTQQDKRAQSKSRSSASAQNTTSSRSNAATDRQTPIQSGREDSRPNQSSQSTQPSAQSGNIAERGMTAPIRRGMNSPFDLMQRMSDDMDRLFEQFGFGRTGLGLGATVGSLLGSDLADRSQRLGGGQSFWAPQVETTRRGDRFVVRADLPGINRDDVHVEVDNDVLTISGERRSEQRDEREGFFRSERSYGSFYRAIPLPEGVNADQCEAKFNDGVLEISLPAPTQPERKTREIPIR